jgi:hypothetical protein
VPRHSERSAAKSKNLRFVLLSQGWETDALNPPQDRFFASIDPALLNCNGAEKKQLQILRLRLAQKRAKLRSG